MKDYKQALQNPDKFAKCSPERALGKCPEKRFKRPSGTLLFYKDIENSNKGPQTQGTLTVQWLIVVTYLSDLVVLLYHFILEIVIRLTVFLGVVQLILKTLELLLDAFNELVMFSVLWVKVVELLLVLKALL